MILTNLVNSQQDTGLVKTGDFMAAGIKHYKRDGTLHTGETHKMPDGTLHSGKTHGKTSVRLFHYKDLSKKAKEKVDAGKKKKSKKA